MFTYVQQQKHCLVLAEHLEHSVSDDNYSNRMLAVAIPEGVKGNALVQAATIHLAGLKLYWATKERAYVLQCNGQFAGQAAIESIFGISPRSEAFHAATRMEAVHSLRKLCQLIEIPSLS